MLLGPSFRVVTRGVAMALALSACGDQGCQRARQHTAAGASATSATSVARPTQTADDAGKGDAGGTPPKPQGPIAITRTGPCGGALPTDRAAEDDEILAVIFPGLDVTTRALGPHLGDGGTPPEPDGGWATVPCAGEPIQTLSAPALGRVERHIIPSATDGATDGGGVSREVVQVSIGTQAALVTTGVGVMALVERRGTEVRVVDVQDVRGSEENAATLDRIRVDRIGSTPIVLVDAQDTRWGEQATSGAATHVRVVRGSTLPYAGMLHTSLRSNGVFWRASHRFVMRSEGVEHDGDALIVDERWTFTDRKTKSKKERTVRRRYSVRDGKLVATPALDLEAWPETRNAYRPLRPGEEAPADDE